MSGGEGKIAAELSETGHEFLNAKGLMNCEVALILEHKLHQQQQQMADEYPINQVFEKSLQHVQRFRRYKNPDSVRQAREILSRHDHRLDEFELCLLGNLCVETVDEALAMVPSIQRSRSGHDKGLDDEVIKKVLNDLSTIKRFE